MGCAITKIQSPTKYQKLKNKKQKANTILLGDFGVGKSTLCRCFTTKFTNTYQVPIGGSYFSSDIKLSKGSKLCLDLWDTPMYKSLRPLPPMYFRQADIAILIFDVCDKKSFQQLEYWIGQLHFCKQQCTVCLIGNKIDNKACRTISSQEASLWAATKSIRYYEISADTGEGVEELFLSLANDHQKVL